MDPAERAAFEAGLNAFIQHAIVVLAVGYFVWKYLLAPLGLGRLWGWLVAYLPTLVTSSNPEPMPEPAPLQPAQPILQTPANVIATPQNSYKHSFAIAPDVQKLADLLDADPEIIEQVGIVLARLCDADKLGETDAIKIGLGISPSSTSEKYKTAKAVLANLRQPVKTEIVALTPDPARPNREVVVRA